MKSRTLAILLACCIPALAYAQIYTWKDAGGRTHFSDQPPPDAQVKTMRGGVAVNPPEPQKAGSEPLAQGSGVPDAKASAPKTWQDQNKDFAKRQTEKAETEAKAKKEQESKAEKERYCTDLRRRIAMLERGGRIGKANDQGELIPLSDNQLQGEVERARAQLAKDCK